MLSFIQQVNRYLGSAVKLISILPSIFRKSTNNDASNGSSSMKLGYPRNTAYTRSPISALPFPCRKKQHVLDYQRSYHYPWIQPRSSCSRIDKLMPAMRTYLIPWYQPC